MAVSPVSLEVAFRGLPRMTPNDERIAWWGDRWMNARWGWRINRYGRRHARGQGWPRIRASRSVSARRSVSASRSVTGCASPDSSSVSSRVLPELDRKKGDAR